MRRLILLILTALAATFPPSLLVSLVSSPPTIVGCATALPHPVAPTRALTYAALTVAAHPQHVASDPQLGGGLSALLGGEFRIPPANGEEAINVEAVEGATKGRLDAFKLSVLGASKGVDSTCVYSSVEFQNNVSSFLRVLG